MEIEKIKDEPENKDYDEEIIEEVQIKQEANVEIVDCEFSNEIKQEGDNTDEGKYKREISEEFECSDTYSNETEYIEDVRNPSDSLHNNQENLTEKRWIEDKNIEITSKPQHKDKPYKCERCDYKSSRSNDLKRHRAIHNRDTAMMFKCDRCEYSSHRMDRLKRHLVIHNKDQAMKYKCGQCDFGSFSKDYLKKHMTIHVEGKVYKCGKCDFSSYCKDNLTKHMITHNKDKLYKCVRCDYSSNYKSNFERHMQRHSKSDKINIVRLLVSDS